jgi:hypothetical protein
LTTIAGIVAFLVVAALVVALGAVLYANRALSKEVRDHLIVLHVSINGLEAKLSPEVLAARESADAAVAEIVALKEAIQKEAPRSAPSGLSVLEGMGKFGKAMAARELFAKAEQDSLDEVNRRG